MKVTETNYSRDGNGSFVPICTLGALWMPDLAAAGAVLTLAMASEVMALKCCSSWIYLITINYVFPFVSLKKSRCPFGMVEFHRGQVPLLKFAAFTEEACLINADVFWMFGIFTLLVASPKTLEDAIRMLSGLQLAAVEAAMCRQHTKHKYLVVIQSRDWVCQSMSKSKELLFLSLSQGYNRSNIYCTFIRMWWP